MNVETTPTRRGFRFTIGTLLIFTLCVGGLLGGFRAGYLWGFSRGAAQQAAERPYPKVYAVADLVLPKNAVAADTVPDFDSLIEAIERNIEPTSWDTVGGPGSIAPEETRLLLIILQTQGIHDRITNLLSQLRQNPSTPAKSSPDHQAP